ncbi:Ankyrin repeat protein 2 [Giardia muris]|uniref:Ankyrin repeat protein 2 n=1 Tax=Giardia muris TaxID=5742 RepID=A0A4Z1SS92_GIAMU|nr:Ankyrin repeat protein 2 [Giardia muris]|eukprot:TNJ28766.1 Ankyrin repeat protein 2 [Giardia muris]
MTFHKLIQPREQGMSLIEAARNGDVKQVRKLIREGVSATDEEGRTALMHAAILGNVEVVSALIPAENNRIDANGCNALMHALLNEQHECVALLKEYETVPEAWCQQYPLEPSPFTGKHEKLPRGSPTSMGIGNENNPYVIALREKLQQQDTEIRKLRWEVKHLTDKLESDDKLAFSEAYLKQKEAEQDETINSLKNSLTRIHAMNGTLFKENREWKEANHQLEKKSHELTHSLQVVEKEREGLRSMVTYLQEQLQSSKDALPSNQQIPALSLDDPRDELDMICRNLNWDQLEELPSDLLDLLIERLKEMLTTSLILQGANRERMCDVCLSTPKNTIVDPCKHCCVCERCAASLIGKACPRCHAIVDNYIIYRT